MTSIEEFKASVEQIEGSSGYQRPFAFGIGLANLDSQGKPLDAYFPHPNVECNYGSAAIFAKVVGHKSGTATYYLDAKQPDEILEHFKAFEGDGKRHGNIEAVCALKRAQADNKKLVISFIGPDGKEAGPDGVPDAYLRLHLLSHRLVRPHGIGLTGIFGTLPNAAWTSEGPVSIEDLDGRRADALANNRRLTVYSVDKFPRMVDYVVPTGVRIADADRVRLGAYLGNGSTVMHEGFVNFNAGCEGPNMIEGRISAGVFVGKGSDLGGGCSTMGTLSGGGGVVISIGENCLLGANSGVGIPLGNNCTVEAGLYITAGVKILFNGSVVKARDLSGKNDLLFRRNSSNGQVEAITKPNSVELNAQLHAN